MPPPTDKITAVMMLAGSLKQHPACKKHAPHVIKNSLHEEVRGTS